MKRWLAALVAMLAFGGLLGGAGSATAAPTCTK
jgi:hypothetical protein